MNFAKIEKHNVEIEKATNILCSNFQIEISDDNMHWTSRNEIRITYTDMWKTVNFNSPLYDFTFPNPIIFKSYNPYINTPDAKICEGSIIRQDSYYYKDKNNVDKIFSYIHTPETKQNGTVIYNNNEIPDEYILESHIKYILRHTKDEKLLEFISLVN